MNLYSDGQQWCSLFVSLTDGGEGGEYKQFNKKKNEKDQQQI